MTGLLHRIHQRIESMWWRNEMPNLLWRTASSVYQHINQYNLQQRSKHVEKVATPIISIGNITVGGSGKTPFVLWLAEQLQQQGKHPVILCRGDGATNQPQAVRVHATDHADNVGDEALMLAQLGNSPVISGKNRIQGARLATQYGDIILFDDGFQYRQLHRDCDIVLIPSIGLGNGQLIPAGPLREPISALQRADIIVRSGQQQNCQAIGSAKEWQWHTHHHLLHDWTTQQKRTPAQVHAVCAIARPQRFINSLQQTSIEVMQHSFFPDHHGFSQADIEALQKLEYTPVFTAKDAVKIKPYWPNHKPLWVLEQQASAEQGLLQHILQTLEKSKACSYK